MTDSRQVTGEIKKVWSIFRVPTFRGDTTSRERVALFDSFKEADERIEWYGRGNAGYSIVHNEALVLPVDGQREVFIIGEGPLTLTVEQEAVEAAKRARAEQLTAGFSKEDAQLVLEYLSKNR